MNNDDDAIESELDDPECATMITTSNNGKIY
jgi:hypothetical protein